VPNNRQEGDARHWRPRHLEEITVTAGLKGPQPWGTGSPVQGVEALRPVGEHQIGKGGRFPTDLFQQPADLVLGIVKEQGNPIPIAARGGVAHQKREQGRERLAAEEVDLEGLKAPERGLVVLRLADHLPQLATQGLVLG
jgi:hypothetical protein